MAKTKLLLDHIIILIPYQALLNPPLSLTNNFTITPGGRHADSKTENKLICFKDGSYIELIAFINDDPSLKEGHWWGKKHYGIIDFAFTTSEDVSVMFSELEERLKKEALKGDDDTGELFGYEAPRNGGRRRDDGVNLKWQVTFPQHVTRGELPFFCHDVTDRSLRVPGGEENMNHPSGVYGVLSLSVMVSPDRLADLLKKYEALLDIKGKEAILNGEFSLSSGARFPIHSVNPAGGSADEVFLHIASPVEDWQKKRVKERGYLIGDLTIGLPHDKTPFSSRKIDLDLDLGGLFVDERSKSNLI